MFHSSARRKSRRRVSIQRLRLEKLEDRRLLATFSVTNLNDSGDGSLREAVSLANSNPGADEVDFAETVAGTIELTSGELEVTEELTITGPAQENLTLDAQHNSRVINFTASTGDLTIGELTLVNGQTREDAVDFNDTSQNGGGIRFVSSGVLNLIDSRVTNNLTLGLYADGGGIFVASGTLNLIDSSVTNNLTHGPGAGGGGIFVASGTTNLIDSSVSNNLTLGNNADGGGIYSGSGSLVLSNSDVRSNITTGGGSDGGGIFSNGSASITNSSITDNRASDIRSSGGGIRSSFFDSLAITDSFVSGNMATGSGGGISVRAVSATAASVTIDSSRVSNNSSGAAGGGIAASGVDIKLTDSFLSNNQSSSEGGGIESLFGSITLNRSELNDNQTFGFGGGISANQTDINVVDSTIDGNLAFELGGGISASGGVVNITRSTISSNIGDDGGAFFGANSDLNLVRSTVSGNVALTSGGGLYGNGDFLIDGSTIVGNTAVEVGGGIDGRGLNMTAAGAITLRNTIIAGNSDNGTASDVVASQVQNLDIFHSLIGNNAGTGLVAAPVGSPDANGNLIGTPDSPIDPLLGELDDNGGPTETHVLLPGSPAIDAGDPLIQSSSDDFLSDQRGFEVVIDGNGDGTRTLDIGAVEHVLTSPVALSFVRDEGGTLARPDLLGSISVSFDVNVNINADDLTIRNDTLGGVIVDTSGLSFSARFGPPTWDFSNLTLEPGFYSFELSDSITSSVGVSLDGDFDGVPGGNFAQSIYVALPGDANLDGQVDVLSDAFALVGNLGTTEDATWAQGDFNGDGSVDVLNDAFVLVANLGRSAIPSEPVPPPATLSLSNVNSITANQSTPSTNVAVIDSSSPVNFNERQDDRVVEKLPTSSMPNSLAGSFELDAAFAIDSLLEDSLF